MKIGMITFFIVLIIAAIIAGYFTDFKKISFKIPSVQTEVKNKINKEDYEYTFGPYSCSGKDLTIQLSYSVNKLAGSESISNLEVTFGPNLTLQRLHVFTDKIQQQTTEDLSFGGAIEQYMAQNHEGVNLPSQEELIERGINTYYSPKGVITLGTDSDVTEQELEEFAQCFAVHKKEIYDAIANKKNELPFYIWFDKAYLIK